jgi:hypothetical protein
VPPAAATHEGPLGRAQEITSTAFRALGLTAPQAAQAAAVGGAVLNGSLVSVMPLAISSLTGQAAHDQFLISVETPRRVEQLDAQQAGAMLAHGPGLLAVHRATLGCQPDGRIVLHRTLDAGTATPQDLVHAMKTTQQLVQLLWGEAEAPQQQ